MKMYFRRTFRFIKWVMFDNTQNSMLILSFKLNVPKIYIFLRYGFIMDSNVSYFLTFRKIRNIDEKCYIFQPRKAIWSKVEVSISKMFSIYVSLYMWKVNLQQKRILIRSAAWSPEGTFLSLDEWYIILTGMKW